MLFPDKINFVNKTYMGSIYLAIAPHPNTFGFNESLYPDDTAFLVRVRL